MTVAIKMADISKKSPSRRIAIAQAKVLMKKQTLKKLKQCELSKGDALATSKVAGIMAAKETSSIIPLCHPLEITNIDINFDINLKNSSLTIISRVCCIARTGVEMEALTAAAIAALTIYDMCKPIDRNMVISEIALLKKIGGKSGRYVRKIKNKKSLACQNIKPGQAKIKNTYKK